MVKVEQIPIQRVWNRLEPKLQDALYGTFVTHKIISTRKAFAALEGINSGITETFSIMKGNTSIPFKGQGSSLIMDGMKIYLFLTKYNVPLV